MTRQWTIIGRLIRIGCAALLLLGNVIVFLPREWTFVHFARYPVELTALELEAQRVDEQHIRICVVDRIGLESRFDDQIKAGPLDGVLGRLRMRKFVDVAEISVWVWDKGSGSEWRAAHFGAKDVWRPTSSVELNFVLPPMADPVDGTYEIYAVLWARPPYGTGELRGQKTAHLNLEGMHVPGSVTLRSPSITERVEVLPP